MKWILTLVTALSLPIQALAEDGYVFGDNHCFYFDFPPGWVADNQTGKQNGLPFVFYPNGSNWSNATTVIYARVHDKNESVQGPEGVIKATLESFHANGSVNAKAEKTGNLLSRHGHKAELYRFSGDKWGNNELVSYFVGPETINYFVMTSRDAKDLDRSKVALEALSKSYRESNDCVPCSEKPHNQALHPTKGSLRALCG